MQNETFKCLVCGKIIAYLSLVEHFQLHKKCGKCKKFLCIADNPEACEDKPTEKKPGNQEKTIGCTYTDCRYSCKRLCDLKRHLDSHNDRKFQCTQCNFSANQKQSLKRHENISHPKDGTGVMFKCDICNYQTTRSDNLKRHQKTKHINDAKEPAKLFVCEICGVKFGALTALKSHSMAKHEMKTYKCRFCDQSFKLQQVRSLS
jgi:uncharacterized Zn-finger protein